VGLGVGEGEGLFAEDVFAVGEGVEGNGGMGMVGGGDDDGVDVFAADDLVEVGGGEGGAGELAGAFEGIRVGITEGEELGSGAEGEAWEVVLEGDGTATDEGDVEGSHGEAGSSEFRVQSSEFRAQSSWDLAR
jgi:hypothetical protein